MNSLSLKRIMREYNELQQCKEEMKGDIQIDQLESECWIEFQGRITGPADTPYEHGQFLLEIKMPNMYPFKSPQIRFITKIWHPNVCSVSGHICLNILGEDWSPDLSLRTVLLSVQVLLSSPELNDPLDTIVAQQYSASYEMFLLTARHWTNVYAGGHFTVPEFDSKVQHLVEMQIDEDRARAVLSANDWDLEMTSEYFKYILQTN